MKTWGKPFLKGDGGGYITLNEINNDRIKFYLMDETKCIVGMCRASFEPHNVKVCSEEDERQLEKKILLKLEMIIGNIKKGDNT
jgi:hypothetical protein